MRSAVLAAIIVLSALRRRPLELGAAIRVDFTGRWKLNEPTATIRCTCCKPPTARLRPVREIAVIQADAEARGRGRGGSQGVAIHLLPPHTVMVRWPRPCISRASSWRSSSGRCRGIHFGGKTASASQGTQKSPRHRGNSSDRDAPCRRAAIRRRRPAVGPRRH